MIDKNICYTNSVGALRHIPRNLRHIKGIQRLAAEMILLAVHDLSRSAHNKEALAWLEGRAAHLPFKTCSQVLGLNEDFLRRRILCSPGEVDLNALNQVIDSKELTSVG
ncbi:MAG: hypothetical protein K9L19_18165 [Desulfarculaceae bacterium]|nr:hypothetical protein [Desulfarculaceae bacterium]MCF8049479.1 hypothetical protein [Desulfarculaceae bacterium]